MGQEGLYRDGNIYAGPCRSNRFLKLGKMGVGKGQASRAEVNLCVRVWRRENYMSCLRTSRGFRIAKACG